jgi:hypothetical protein
MFDSFLHQASAIGADVFASLSIVATAAWTWVLAQPLWLTVSVAAGIKLIAFGLILREWRSKRAAAGKRTKRLTSVAPKKPKVEVVADSSSRRPTPAQSARILVSRGVPEVEISRQTGLARDAVSLLVAAPKSSATRQGRPTAAGVAVPATSARTSERLALRA